MQKIRACAFISSFCLITGVSLLSHWNIPIMLVAIGIAGLAATFVDALCELKI